MNLFWIITITLFLVYYNEHRLQWYKRKSREQLKKYKDERQAKFHKEHKLKDQLQKMYLHSHNT